MRARARVRAACRGVGVALALALARKQTGKKQKRKVKLDQKDTSSITSVSQSIVREPRTRTRTRTATRRCCRRILLRLAAPPSRLISCCSMVVLYFLFTFSHFIENYFFLSASSPSVCICEWERYLFMNVDDHILVIKGQQCCVTFIFWSITYKNNILGQRTSQLRDNPVTFTT